jgi:hypothetical protein
MLKTINIYEGLDENEKKSEIKSENKNIVVMANNG